MHVGDRVMPRDGLATGTIEEIRPSSPSSDGDYLVAEVLWDSGARCAEPLSWLGRLDDVQAANQAREAETRKARLGRQPRSGGESYPSRSAMVAFDASPRPEGASVFTPKAAGNGLVVWASWGPRITRESVQGVPDTRTRKWAISRTFLGSIGGIAGPEKRTSAITATSPDCVICRSRSGWTPALGPGLRSSSPPSVGPPALRPPLDVGPLPDPCSSKTGDRFGEVGECGQTNRVSAGCAKKLGDLREAQKVSALGCHSV
jgi:hypothetical protein